MNDSNNSWNEWSRHVLKELERLNGNYEQISRDVHELKSKINNFTPEDVAILKVQATTIEKDQKSLVDRDNDFETRLRSLEQTSSAFSGKWAILGVIGAALIAGLVSWFFSMASAPAATSKVEQTDDQKTIEHILSPKEFQELKKTF